MEDLVKFKAKIRDQGESSKIITLPKELLEYINAKSGDELTLTGDMGKHGKYLAFYKTQENPKPEERNLQ